MGYCEHCNGTVASTMRGIYLMNMMGVYSLPRNDSAPCSQLKSRLALSSDIFIPLQGPTRTTQHTTLTLQTRIQTGITVKYIVSTEHMHIPFWL